MSYCPYCGAALMEGARFCSACGGNVIQVSAVTQTIVNPVTTTLPSTALYSGEGYGVMLVDCGACAVSTAADLISDTCGYTDADAMRLASNAPTWIAQNLTENQAAYLAQCLTEYGAQAAIYDRFGNKTLLSDVDSVFDGAGSSFSWTETTLSNYSEATVDGVDYLCFGYYGIAAKEMGSELRATLYMKRDGVQYSTTVDIYSVAEYAYNRLNKSSDDRLKTLLVDMLDYGAASQTYLKYNTSNLVNAKLTSAQRAYGSEMPQPVPNELLISVEGNTAHFYGKSLILGNNVEIKYYMTFDNGKPADSVKLVLSYTSIDGKEYTKVVKASDFVYESKYKAYSASIDSIGAKDMSCVVTAKIYDGDTLIGDVCKYSIETYVYNRLQKSTDENLKAAVIAMYRYGKSAEQYFLNK